MTSPCRTDLPLAFAEGRPGPARDAFVAHLATCPACTRAVARLRAARAALLEYRDAEPPALDYGRVQAGVLAQLDEPAPPRRGWLVPVFAGAAALAAVVVVVGLRGGRPGPTGPAAGGGTPAVAAAATPLRAVPILVQGEVTALPQGQALSPRTPLGAGAGARVAAGRVALQLGDGTAVVSGEGSELGLRALDSRDIIITLTRGRLYAQVAHRAPGQRFVVVTPGHSVAVRGTRYSVERLAAATRVEVLEGEVEVHTMGTGWDALGARVPAGTTIEFPDGESPARAVGTALTPAQRERFAAAARVPLLPGFSDAERAMDQSGVVELGATPGAAATLLDGVPLGPTPVAVRAGRGRHTVQLSRPGAGRELRTLEVGPEPQRVSVRLVRPEEENARAVEVGRRVRERLKDLRHCYEHGLRVDPGISGVAELQITVGEDGHVQRAAVGRGSGLPPAVEACFTTTARRWSFTKGPQVTVAHPLVLRPELDFSTP